MRERVRGSGIHRDGAVGKVRCAVTAHYDVFKQCPEADGVVYLRLLAAVKADALGIAAAFDVENAVIRPAVLIVPNEASVRGR